MDQRKENLLNKIIEEHIRTAQPVGSGLLVNKYFDLSSATLRNEMAELEKSGYLNQPHTSAGRLPTEAAWQYYLANLDGLNDLSIKEKSFLRQNSDSIKDLAKGLAELSGQMVFVGFTSNDFYYTGLTNLFSQPEFQDIDLVRNMSRIIDRLDEAIKKLFSKNNKGNGPEVLIGQESPFAEECAALVINCRIGRNEAVLGILGPLRMDYRHNLALLSQVQAIINK